MLGKCLRMCARACKVEMFQDLRMFTWRPCVHMSDSVSFFLSYFSFRISGFQLLCVCTENFLTSWFTGLHKHCTNPNLMWAKPLFYLGATLFRPLMLLIEKCKRLWGQQIHCSEGATSESDLFDLGMVLVSNKLTSNRGYLVWLGAICAGIINWPNSRIYGKTCALSLL